MLPQPPMAGMAASFATTVECSHHLGLHCGHNADVGGAVSDRIACEGCMCPGGGN